MKNYSSNKLEDSLKNIFSNFHLQHFLPNKTDKINSTTSYSHASSSPVTTVDITFDSAASDNYIRPKDKDVLRKREPYQGPPVMLPDADTLAPFEKGQLPLSENFSTAVCSNIWQRCQRGEN